MTDDHHPVIGVHGNSVLHCPRSTPEEVGSFLAARLGERQVPTVLPWGVTLGKQGPKAIACAGTVPSGTRMRGMV